MNPIEKSEYRKRYYLRKKGDQNRKSMKFYRENANRINADKKLKRILKSERGEEMRQDDLGLED